MDLKIAKVITRSPLQRTWSSEQGNERKETIWLEIGSSLSIKLSVGLKDENCIFLNQLVQELCDNYFHHISCSEAKLGILPLIPSRYRPCRTLYMIDDGIIGSNRPLLAIKYASFIIEKSGV